MSATVSEIKEAIAAGVKAIIRPNDARMEFFSFTPDRPPMPCLYVGEVNIDPDTNFGAGSDTYTFRLVILVSASDDKDGQARLDSYVSRTGVRSIRAALETLRGNPGEYALGGLVSDLHVTRVDGYGYYTLAENRFFGATIQLTVLGR